MSVFIVVDTETGQYYGCFSTWQFAYASIGFSYHKVDKELPKIIHRDAYNTDVEIANHRFTIKAIVPMEFVEHL
jgi:hypothetical protein